MTAGHCVEKGANYIVGTAVVKQMADNEKYDYAFIQTNSNYTPTNTLYHKASNVTKLAVVDYCPSIYVGTIISRSGAVSKYSSGQIQAINVTADYKANGIRIQGLVETNLTSRPGDSGAPVFIPKKDSEGGGIAVGIVSGGGEGIMYFTSINNFPAALQNRY